MIKAQNGRAEMTGTATEIKIEFKGICEGVYKDICKGDNEEFMQLVDEAKKVAMMSEDEKNKGLKLLREIFDMTKGDKNDEED